MKVLKFGGGCLKDAESIKKLPIILKQYDENIIIVISAFIHIKHPIYIHIATYI